MAIIQQKHDFHVGKGKQHHRNKIVDGGANGYIEVEVPTCTDCGGYERYGPEHGVAHTALCVARLAGGETDDSRENDKLKVMEALFKTASTLLGLDLTAAKAAVEAMGEYAPGRWPEATSDAGMKRAGAVKGDEEAQFLSEAYLYPLFGKDEARTILAKWSAVRKAVGFPW